MSKIYYFVVGAVEDPAVPLGVWATDGKDLDIRYVEDAAEDEQHWLKAFWPDGDYDKPPTLPPAIKLDFAGMEHLSQGLGYGRWATKITSVEHARGLYDFVTLAMGDLRALGRRVASVQGHESNLAIDP